jgi:hypothetical protein
MSLLWPNLTRLAGDSHPEKSCSSCPKKFGGLRLTATARLIFDRIDRILQDGGGRTQ